MVIGWPSIQRTGTEHESLPIAVAPLPGSNRSFDFRTQKWEAVNDEVPQAPVLVPVSGRVAAVSSDSRRLRTALRMIAWLMTAEANREFTPHYSDLLFTQSSQLSDPYPWVREELPREAASQMAEVLRDYHAQAMFVPNLRIPGRDQYRRALAEAVESAVNGSATAQDALTAAAERWEEITEQLGRETQRKIFQGSVGLE
jgi:multiple sugar transport system substrate-binding protein